MILACSQPSHACTCTAALCSNHETSASPSRPVPRVNKPPPSSPAHVLSPPPSSTKPTKTAFVIQTLQESSSGDQQPYPRGVSNQLLTVKIGKIAYQQMIDTGSTLLSMPCNTAITQKRGCSPNANLYTLGSSSVLSKAQCMANTTGCYASSSGCAWSSAVSS